MSENPIVSGYKAKYEKTLEQENPDRPYPQIVSFVEKYKGQLGTRIADLGSGNGRNLIYLSQVGFDPVGVELNPAGVAATKKHLEKMGLRGEAVVGDVNVLPLAASSFDSAISRRVFDYSDDEEAEKKFYEASRILKNGSLFFLSARSIEQPAKANEEMLTENPLGGKTFLVKSGSEQGVKQHYFTRAELEQLAEKSGFEVLSIESRTYGGEKTGEQKYEWLLELKKKADAQE